MGMWVIITRRPGDRVPKATLTLGPPTLSLVNPGWLTDTDLSGDLHDWPLADVQAVYETDGEER